VLVVDDNHDAASMLASSLRALGHTVHVAHDGPAALRDAPGFGPEVAVLDIGLPAMDGYELARALRALPKMRGLRLIAVTGYGQDADRRRTAEAGFDGHLVKPVALRAVDALVRGTKVKAP
jgi:CheY-like chemotaxis protein